MIKLYMGLSNCDVRMHCIALNGNDTSHQAQSMAKPMKITKLVKNVKFTQKYTLFLSKLFIMILSRNINI